jgi:long-chain acyl-CoA synthetase
MLDPLSLLPLSLAAHGGRVDEFEVQQLVAAGLTLLQRSAPLVRALAGKRSAILLPTSPQFFVALAASEGRGAVLVSPLAAPYEIAHQVADAGVGAVFTNAALAAALPPDLPRVLLDDAPRRATVVANGTAREIDLGSHVGLSLEGDPDAPGSDEEATIVYTSAMAGVPLGAILTHRNLLTNARSTMAATANSSGDRVLALLPFSHLFGLTVTASAPLLAGGTIVTMPRFNPARAAELLTSGQITEVVGVPSVFRSLLTALTALTALARRVGARDAQRNLRLCICGGAPLSVRLQEQWFDATGSELRQGYGLTEAGPVCLFNGVDRPNVRGALGAPLPGVEVALRDGEICVRGDNVFRGYVSNNGDGLAVAGGWLHTGDRGGLAADGSIVFAGLIKPMFTRNGFNIYPREIERTVEELDGVERARVYAVPGEDDEAEVAIALDVRGTTTEAAVRAWCAERLSRYKQPSIIRLL